MNLEVDAHMEPLEHAPLTNLSVAGRCALASTCGAEELEYLTLLAHDSNQEVRLRVALNPALPALHRKAIVARDGHDAIRAYGEKMAQSERSESVLEALAQCPYPSVQALVARNEHTTDAVLEDLAENEHENVRATAREVLGW